ncbi:MAG: hypothetical protein K2Z81_08155 [Cyanobacteria bacterium]|nr:hypothetical protein [Cyanobacteriota bacterium]
MNKILSTLYVVISSFLVSAPAFADIIDPRPLSPENPASAAVAGGLLFGAAVIGGFVIARKLTGNS